MMESYEPMRDFLDILTSPQCKHCGSSDIHKDGIARWGGNGSLRKRWSQIYRCKSCGKTSSFIIDDKENLRQLIVAMKRYGLKVLPALSRDHAKGVIGVIKWER